MWGPLAGLQTAVVSASCGGEQREEAALVSPLGGVRSHSRGCPVRILPLSTALLLMPSPGGCGIATYEIWGTLVVPNRGSERQGKPSQRPGCWAGGKPAVFCEGLQGPGQEGPQAASPSPEWPWPCEPQLAASVLQTQGNEFCRRPWEPGRVPRASDAGLASTWTGAHGNSEAVSGSVLSG